MGVITGSAVNQSAHLAKEAGSDAANFNRHVKTAAQNNTNPGQQNRPGFTPVYLNTSPLQRYDPLQPVKTESPGGQTEHVYKKDETLDAIASQYGLTREDLLLTNPDLAKKDPQPGDKLVVLADKDRPNIAKARLDVAREMAKTTDPEKLTELVAEDIELATLASATPEDLMDGLKTSLAARRPGDVKFAETVDGQLGVAKSRWLAQGRTHAVFDPLTAAAASGDWQKVEDLTVSLFATYAKTNPKADGLADPRKMLLTYGPDNARFRQAVTDAEHEFLVEGPRRAADQVRAAYAQGGVIKGTQKLREMTSAENADPLTASLILKELEPTIMQFIDDYNQKGWLPATGTDIGGALSSAVDNASRTGDAQTKQLIERMAARFIEHGKKGASYYAFVPPSIMKGDGVILPLEIAAQLRTNGETEESDHILGLVLGSIEPIKDENRKLVGDLVKAAAPLLVPLQNSEGYMRDPTESELQKWFADHPSEVGKVNDILKKINTSGYELARVLAGLEEYESSFYGTEHYDDILDNLKIVTHVGPVGPLPAEQQRKMGAPGADEPALVQALVLSEEGMIEVSRELNMEGGENGTIYNPYTLLDQDRSQVIADPSWPIRMVRNHVQADMKALTGAKPASMGLSLFGVSTYLWGVKSHGQELLAKTDAHGFTSAFFQEDGWRNAGFLGLYAAGIGIEGVQTYSAAKRHPDSAWSKGIFSRHLQAFGWWNVIGTANYVAKGDWPHAIALGSAAGGTLWSTTLASWAKAPTSLSGSWFGKALKMGKWGGPVATAITLAGSAAIWGIDQHERVELSNLTEPYAADWYARMGVPPEIARHLGNNDRNGVDAFTRFDKIVEQTGLDRAKFMNWLVAQGDDFVGRFVERAVHPVETDDDGNLKLTDPKGDLMVVVNAEGYLGQGRLVRRADDGRWVVNIYGHEKTYDASAFTLGQPTSIKGIALWAEFEGHPLPVATS